MLNIIRADLYRIFRGKGLYITGIIFVAVMVLQMFTDGTIGVNSDLVAEAAGELTRTGSNIPFIRMADNDVLLYYLLPLIVFIVATDFSAGTVKNVLASGMSPRKFYLAKLLLSGIFCVVLILINTIVPMIVATVSQGFGGEFDKAYLARVMKPFLSQMLMFLAVTCFGVFLAFATKRTGAVIGGYIAWLFVPLLVIVMLMEGFPERFAELYHYDVTLNIKALAYYDMMSKADIIRAYALGGFYIVASTIGGMVILHKSEIK
ncbi:MAG: ABC transporter permease subunit [Lachnospiraceae bacterium]|jgi:ABC-2 type transport system permease protein|nr:ABC transporter permease subunit [Lachnospiraceae bacterium]